MTMRVAPIIGEVPSVRDIRLRSLDADDPSTPKGARTWNLLHPANATAGRTMIACREQGEPVGNHFHIRTVDKDPETFLLIVGVIRFWFKDLHGAVREILMDADALGPLLIEIPPYILHSVRIESPTAWYLEQQSEAYSTDKTYTAAEFDLLELVNAGE
jgi:hypothetical protein